MQMQITNSVLNTKEKAETCSTKTHESLSLAKLSVGGETAKVIFDTLLVGTQVFSFPIRS